MWAFRQPAKFGNMTIRNCDKVTLIIACSAVKKFTKELVIENVKQLVINPSILPHLPEIVVFRRIGFIERIQKETFSQIYKRTNRPSCFVHGANINSITFENVTIGTIETEAFPDMTDMKHFLWDKVLNLPFWNYISIRLLFFFRFSLFRSSYEFVFVSHDQVKFSFLLRTKIFSASR